MPLVKYQDEKHIKNRIRAKELYQERYKMKRKILYLCKKMELNKKELSLQFDNDKDFYLHLKKLEFEKIQDKDI